MVYFRMNQVSFLLIISVLLVCYVIFFFRILVSFYLIKHHISHKDFKKNMEMTVFLLLLKFFSEIKFEKKKNILLKAYLLHIFLISPIKLSTVSTLHYFQIDKVKMHSYIQQKRYLNLKRIKTKETYLKYMLILLLFHSFFLDMFFKETLFKKQLQLKVLF